MSQETPTQTVVVVGGGFSGSVFALKYAHMHPDARVIVVERNRRVGRGLAYGACAPDHLLNVPVSRMELGLVPAFGDWLQSHRKELDEALAESGDPVEPSARSFVRSPASARSMSALVQPAKKAAPAPKKVDLDLETNRHSVDQSGFSFDPPGLPSKMQQVVPFSRPATWQFHMIQPVELYQW